ncbi:hypothetical protein [Segniliparus rugosus]|uniref:hypothetical protein n=1 Tax=Segniliparus rugosus TaxID=286804 RepID=UPI0002EAB00D|nr:hypothetical protein [Segniliparus rugosus]
MELSCLRVGGLALDRRYSQGEPAGWEDEVDPRSGSSRWSTAPWDTKTSYPFVLPPKVLDKLAHAHGLIAKRQLANNE